MAEGCCPWQPLFLSWSLIFCTLSHSYLFIGKNNATSSNLFSTMVAAVMDINGYCILMATNPTSTSLVTQMELITVGV
jgi:hypothetical protein